MVEFVLLFALGFLTALLLGLFLAPAIFARVVRYTEKRLLATVPISGRELKAARDLERAAFAMENRKLSVEFRQERERRIEENKRADRLGATAGAMRGEIAELVQQVEAMSIDAADMRSGHRQEKERADALRLALSEAERGVLDRDQTNHVLADDVRRLSIDVEDMRIEIAARETEVESLRYSLEMANEERRRLRDRLNVAEGKAKDLEFRLQREESRSEGLEERLAETLSTITDQENTLERRLSEVARLRDKLKTANADLGAAEQTLRQFEEERRRQAIAARMDEDRIVPMHVNGNRAEGPAGETGPEIAGASKAAISQRVERLRARHTALVDRLVAANDTKGDEELRSEIKEIAASMISLTAAREGAASPIHAIITNGEENGVAADGARQPSLAIRAAAQMRE